MKKLLCIGLIISALVTPVTKTHAMDAKGKAFLIICGYGTVGGALLGFASMAFGSNSRAIAQGASLGLYAGIGFGAYVIASHEGYFQKPAVDPYNQQQTPPPGYGAPGGGVFGNDGGYNNGGYPNQGYDNSGYGNSGYGGGNPPAENNGGFFGSGQRAMEINDDLVQNYRLKNEKGRDFSLPIYVPLYYGTF